jgi:hypothetical protein
MTAFDPDTQQCFGLYGYGTGYKAKETAARAALIQGIGQQPVEGFCVSCPKRNECWESTAGLVEIRWPLEFAAYNRAMEGMIELGVPREHAGQLLSAALAQVNIMDPYAVTTVENAGQGQKDRAE